MQIPITVPHALEQKYRKNKELFTFNDPQERAFLFAADQRLEHLYDDFQAPETSDPKHLFSIASKSPIGAFATHFGLIARYAPLFPDIPYVVKMNGKSNLVPLQSQDPLSSLLFSCETVLQATNRCNIIGLGYTIYLGSLYESTMLHEAATVVAKAHENGLLAILWIYPRGNYINTQKDFLSAGAAGVGASLGADYVKIIPPTSFSELQKAVTYAGNTNILCAGGPAQEPVTFLKNLQKQREHGIKGFAIGRNIFQKKESEAIEFCKQIHDLLYS